MGYKEIEDEMAKRSAAHEEFLASIQLRIQQRMEQEGIRCKVYGRVKHSLLIYRKMFTQNKTLDEIFDLYAFRVIVDDIPSAITSWAVSTTCSSRCWAALRTISAPPSQYVPVPPHHRHWPGRHPLRGADPHLEMHQTAEYGIAAHWKYKQGMANKKLGTEGDFEWVRKLLESQQDTDAEEFVRTLKVDLFADEVFVFTPNGDVKSLPAGATPSTSPTASTPPSATAWWEPG